MKCQNCNAKATVHHTQLQEGEVKKLHYCESCAETEGILDVSGFGLESTLTSGEEVSGAKPETGKVCSGCGFSLAKFQQTGRLGCSQCYLTFTDEILARLAPMHRGLLHLGKQPADFNGDVLSKRLLNECQERLARAVASEDYEEAAKIRDEISELENTEKKDDADGGDDSVATAGQTEGGSHL